MSCITQLLELKGEKDYLQVHDSVVIEGGGVYKDFEYLIVFTDYGHRCGYVAIPNGCRYDSDGLRVHGGITFEDEDHPAKDLLPVHCNDTWLGFDAAHSGDIGCYNKARRIFGDQDGRYNLLEELNKPFHRFPSVTHKSFEYMENECKYLIDQLIEANHAH
jgi:hypothetical protein